MLNKYMLFFVLSAAVAAASQGLLKAASNKSKEKNRSFFRSLLDWRVLLAYFLLFGTTLLNMMGYRQNPLSVGAFINTLSYIFVGVISVVFFKEKMSGKMLIAYGLIVIGVAIIVL